MRWGGAHRVVGCSLNVYLPNSHSHGAGRAAATRRVALRGCGGSSPPPPTIARSGLSGTMVAPVPKASSPRRSGLSSGAALVMIARACLSLQSDGPGTSRFRRGPFGCGPARHWGVVRACWVSVTPEARSVPAGLSSPGLGPACALWGRSVYGVAAICWVSVRPLRRALSRFPSSLSVLRPSLLSLPAALVSLSGRAWLCFLRFSFDESLSLFESMPARSLPAP
jgi:hypothetical protein